MLRSTYPALYAGGVVLTPEDQQRMNELCTRIQQEPDAAKLTALVDELNDLLGKKELAPQIPHTQKTA